MKAQLEVKTFFILLLILCSCKDDDSEKPSSTVGESQRNFEMGFTTCPYGPTQIDVDSTYLLIHANGDCYTEHLDNKIPWKALIDSTPFPAEFLNDLTGRKGQKPTNKSLILSVSLLNGSRADLIEDYDGSVPNYTQLNDSTIEIAYFDYLDYLIEELNPSYLIAALEVNELLEKDATKWAEYKLLIAAVKARLKAKYPTLMISESITLHNWYEPGLSTLTNDQQEVNNYISTQDFAAISFYPFIAGLSNEAGFNEAFDFLNTHVTIPIAFSETGHLAEDLIIPNLNTNIKSDPIQQQQYMDILLNNAQNNDYKFITWWTYRDYDKLWNTFPANVKDIGKIWRDTGIEDEKGAKRPAYSSWNSFYKMARK